MASSGSSEIISRQGYGFLEKEHEQRILHLKGTPYERGYQHGVLLRDEIKQNITTFIDPPKSESNLLTANRISAFLKNFTHLLSYIPEHFLEEMKGLSDGTSIPLHKIMMLNLFPEMFHCSAITVSGEASKNQELYHVRVLDYSIGKSLQNTAVLQVVEPEEGIPFLNVSYAGFIGTITGMNLEKISIGEIGGLGYGSWQGVPMAFLLRDCLQNAASLNDAKTLLQNSPRTCEYYYILSDGKTNESIGIYATASQLEYFIPGEDYALLAPPSTYEPGNDNKVVLSSCNISHLPYQTLLFSKDGSLSSLFHYQPKDCLLLTGFSHPERYPILVERILENYGSIDEKILMQIIQCPVSKQTNLHNAIFSPTTLKVWISHAGPNNEPAYTQPYQEWDLLSLLNY